MPPSRISECTIYVDDYPPQMTDSVLETALGRKCRKYPIYPQKSRPKQLYMMNHCPFMMSGMPRSAWALAAEMEMLVNCPTRPDQRTNLPMKLKQLMQKHARKASYLLQIQVGDEEKLAMQQSEMKANYNKCEMLDTLFSNRSHTCLAF
ncbi:hypothetical protein MKW94_010824 [Papaver nudicaule]|uniref:Uncharacterized protein n=1 Tax=Papaver nudicaule TaxID=74823 RepID=A0AA41VC67_PAPNU|nr:hypothetical protein [Papaver nudicaule]